MMVISHLLKWVLVIEVIVYGATLKVEALSMFYYAAQCPMAEIIVRNTVNRALQKDPTLSGPLLRMHFHDCFVEVIHNLYYLIAIYLIIVVFLLKGAALELGIFAFSCDRDVMGQF